MTLEVRFWGVRGSIASPGPKTALVGGNTSCVEVLCGSERLIFDAGTGLRALGDSLIGSGEKKATLLLSHHHWDHIQGLPFFVPLYLPDSEIRIIGPKTEKHSMRDVLAHQMTSPVFPVRLNQVPSRLETEQIAPGHRLEVGGATISTAKLNHPGGCLAYRVDYQGKSVVYATDTEHYACVDPELRRLAAGADILIYDCQYTPEEYDGKVGPPRTGWGHSTFVHGAQLAMATGAKKLVLYHHDPRRDDDAVAAIEAQAQSLFVDSVAAREGLRLEVGQASSNAA